MRKSFFVILIIAAIMMVAVSGCNQPSGTTGGGGTGDTGIYAGNAILGTWVVTTDKYATPGLVGLNMSFYSNGTGFLDGGLGVNFTYTLRTDTNNYITITGISELNGEKSYVISTDATGTYLNFASGNFILKKI